MSDQTQIRETIIDDRSPPPVIVALSFAILPLTGLFAWMLLQVAFDAPVALWMFALVLGGILFTEDKIAGLARGVKPPAAAERAMYPARRVRVAHALTYAPLFAFCFVQETSGVLTAFGEWIGGFLLVFALMLSASEISALAARHLAGRDED